MGYFTTCRPSTQVLRFMGQVTRGLVLDENNSKVGMTAHTEKFNKNDCTLHKNSFMPTGITCSGVKNDSSHRKKFNKKHHVRLQLAQKLVCMTGWGGGSRRAPLFFFWHKSNYVLRKVGW